MTQKDIFRGGVVCAIIRAWVWETAFPAERILCPADPDGPAKVDSSTPRWMRARRRENDFTDSERKRR